MNGVTVLFLFACIALGIWLAVWRILKYKNLNVWVWSYLLDYYRARTGRRSGTPTHVYFTLIDHFEPFHGGRSKGSALSFVNEWCDKYPIISRRYTDADNNHPRHTIFYPEETYDPEVMDRIALVHDAGSFDVEIHLHHDRDNSEDLRRKLLDFKKTLYERHGLLRRDPVSGQIIYGFVHGNWALDNSRADGRMCGVNDELKVLAETGCYADFTLPSAPSDTQTKKINSVYYATDDPLRPKSHDSGIDVKAEGKQQGDLLIVQGPLALNWKKQKYFLFPGIENGEISEATRFDAHRLRLWIDRAPYVRGEPGNRFVKVYTHGCEDSKTMRYLLESGLDDLYATLCDAFNDGRNYVLHLVTPYEMCLKIKELERGSGISSKSSVATADLSGTRQLRETL